ncbi:MAG: ABC transporter ATP-binding protein [Mollicutes bacterium PWAP]|nr:ABC transporter ATP-binding protein [Mollicutes bacterium PWAP]
MSKKNSKIEQREINNDLNEEIKIRKKISKIFLSEKIRNSSLLSYPIYKGKIQNQKNVLLQKINQTKSNLNKKIIKSKSINVDKEQIKITQEIKVLKKDLNLLENKLNYQKNMEKEEISQSIKLNKNPKGAPKAKNSDENIIDVKNLNKFYTNKKTIFHALKNINLTIKKGTFNVILGSSGSGKTTLLNMIGGLDNITGGEVIVNNINLTALKIKELTQFRRIFIGFVFQSYNLLPSLNVFDNVEVGMVLQMDKPKRKNINELLERMNMGFAVKKSIYELSGGQQQRVSIARALAKSPSILIGDEPTGALDSKTSAKVFQLFQEINREEKATIIIVTHNPKVAKLADQVIKVENGEIIEIIHNKKPLDAREIEDI